jgi:hypothetical protein
MPELQVIANHTIAGRSQEEVPALLPRLSETARTEPGDASVDGYRKVDDPEETS